LQQKIQVGQKGYPDAVESQSERRCTVEQIPQVGGNIRAEGEIQGFAGQADEQKKQKQEAVVSKPTEVRAKYQEHQGQNAQQALISKPQSYPRSVLWGGHIFSHFRP
jgi:hypothetical protein